ncbi:substrate-binding domain-containing protein [Roseospira navarrensis]|uniref:substrate-binding domain-containing protein n=1 Tax=Roseospira navarrensis TaxID=140058 RepID=UPI001B87F07D
MKKRHRPSARRSVLALAALLLLPLQGCDDGASEPASETEAILLIYCGITMLHPIRAIVDIFAAETGARVTISQGGSEDLYKSLALSRIGDLYFPGSLSYRERHLDEGLLGPAVRVGYNVAALVVTEGNPKGIAADVAVLTDPALSVVIANPESGSIGREAQRILEHVGLYGTVLDNISVMATDSRNLNFTLVDGTADVALNWRATAFFPENRDRLDVLDIDPALAVPKTLAINRLTFSEHPDLAQRFMDLAASPRGQAIFRSYGFLDRDGLSED